MYSCHYSIGLGIGHRGHVSQLTDGIYLALNVAMSNAKTGSSMDLIIPRGGGKTSS